ncbi:hypothetical protein [Allomuricauda sp. d1]|uniref:hypothetical protein n=1 Tax=Allomuricauda sp. d1 TaxID=3136725 RepID=UPI0031D9D29D
MRRNTYLIIAFTAMMLTYSNLHSQDLPNSNFSGSNLDLDAQGGNPGLDFVFQQFRNKKYEPEKFKYEGSPFFNENFKKAGIYSKDGLEGYAYVRYDGFSDEVQLKKYEHDEKIQSLLKRKDIYCVVDGTPVMLKTYETKSGTRTEGYLFRRVDAGDLQLYERKIKYFKEGKKARTSLELNVPNRFVESKEYYVGKKQNDGEAIIFLKQSKKEVLKTFSQSEKYPSIKKFISEKGLNLKRDKDIFELFSYYNTL